MHQFFLCLTGSNLHALDKLWNCGGRIANTAKASVNFCALFLRASGSISSSSSELPTSVARKPMSKKRFGYFLGKLHFFHFFYTYFPPYLRNHFAFLLKFHLRHFSVVFTKKSAFLVPSSEAMLWPIISGKGIGGKQTRHASIINRATVLQLYRREVKKDFFTSFTMLF